MLQMKNPRITKTLSFVIKTEWWTDIKWWHCPVLAGTFAARARARRASPHLPAAHLAMAPGAFPRSFPEEEIQPLHCPTRLQTPSNANVG